MDGRSMRCRSSRLARAARDDGAVAVLAALLMVALIGMTALAVDVGDLYQERRKMQTAADAAALAGVQELPAAADQAVAIADNYVDVNAPEATIRDIQVTSTNVANDTVAVDLTTPDSPLYFARVLPDGLEEAAVHAKARAVVDSPSGYARNVFPFGIMSREITSAAAPFGYTFGEWVDLKVGIDDKEQGNFHFLDLGGGGVTNLPDVIYDPGRNPEGGAQIAVNVGDLVDLKPGQNAEPALKALKDYLNTCGASPKHDFGDLTQDALGHWQAPTDPDGYPCPRLIICPVIVNPKYPASSPLHWNWDYLKGKSQPVEIIGFAYFWVEPQDVRKEPPQIVYSGRFVDIVSVTALNYGGLNPYGGIHFSLVE